jgi:transposase
MSYRPYPSPAPLLIGYDPFSDLPQDHLARFVEAVVEEAITVPLDPPGAGQPPFDPRLPLKVLVYGYATGIRSSRRLEQLCTESLPYLFLTRGDTPGYRTLCRTRVEQSDQVEQVWISLFTVAGERGLKRLGQLVVDSTKLRADASPEAVIKAEEYEALRAELAGILAEAEAVDAREEQEGPRGTTRLGQAVEREQMRDIVRRVRQRLAAAKRAKKAAEASRPKAARRSAQPAAGEEAAAAPPDGAPPGGAAVPAAPPEAAGAPALATGPRQRLTRRMRQRVAAGIAALDAAMTEQRKHLCLTDPDARMMGGGRSRRVQECYSWEVAVDREAGLLVVGQVTQEASDNSRLEPLVEAAQAHEPDGVKAVDGDCGFYQGGPLGRLIRAGIDPCVPDSSTAGDLHRGQPVGTVQALTRGRVAFVYDPEGDCYRCPEGNELRRDKSRVAGGQKLVSYAAQRPCPGCPRESECLLYPEAQYRTVTVGEYQAELDAARQRFDDPAHRERYRHRGEVVETVFGFVRETLGYGRWLLRGVERVGCEARLIKLAYQLRKVQASGARG